MDIETDHRGESGWLKCPCKCAWEYEDVGDGVIELSKVRECE